MSNEQLGFNKAPDRYSAKGRETIDKIRDSMSDEAFIAFCRGQAIKYRDRAGLKGSAEQDLEKAKFYIQMANHVKFGTPDPRTYRAEYERYTRRAYSYKNHFSEEEINPTVPVNSGEVEYSVGFLFSNDYSEVVLIRKNRPARQENKLNGVGGHIEPGETPLEAMVREFHEEAGLVIAADTWRSVFVLTETGKYKVHFFFATHDNIHSVRSMTDEKIEIHSVSDVHKNKEETVYNIPGILNIIQLIAHIQK